MIKVFTTDESPDKAGDILTSKFDNWVKGFSPNYIEVINIHTNSNKYGWMMVIQYKIVR